MPITVINVAGGSTKDVNVVLPADLDVFWDTIDTAAAELRVTSGDGYTLLAYSVDNGSGGSFNRATRAGRIQIDGMAVPGTTNEAVLAWLYFDSGDDPQGSAAVATTISAAETGTIDRGSPSTWVAEAETPRPGIDTTRDTFGKSAADQGYLFLDVTRLLERRSSQFAGKRMYEEPRAATYQVQDDAASPQSSMIDTTKTRWVETQEENGRHLYLGLFVKAGTAGDQYTAIASILTAVPLESGTHRTLTTRAGFRVRDNLET